MKRSGLARLLRPRHVAVFGGDWAANVVEQCLRMGFEGDIWPVHPTRSDMHGIACYRSVSDLPAPPDASFIGVNRDLTPEILRQLAARGAGGAICFASGYAESEIEEPGGRHRQQELVVSAGEMTILGPNCYGLVNYLDGVALWPDQHGGERCSSGVAIIAQSSNIAINMTMQTRGLPIACVVTVGNQSQTSLTDIATELLDDPRITALGLHIEGFGETRKFEQLAARARQLRKPIAAMKAGTSLQGRETVISHTGAIAGSEAFSSALLHRLGIARLRSIPCLLETLKLLHLFGPLKGRRIGSLSCSGGEACLMADAAQERMLDFPDLGPAQSTALKEALGPRVHLANPLDYHTYHWGNETALREIFSAMHLGNYDLLFLVMDFPRPDRCSDIAWEPAVRAIEQCTDRPTGLLSTLPECLPESWSSRLISSGIAPMHGVDEALAAAEAAADIGEVWSRPSHPLWVATPPLSGSETLNEADSKRLLAASGLTVPRFRTAATAEAAAESAAEVGFPVVLKAVGPAHKTEAGAVILNLRNRHAVASACRAMPEGGNYLIETQIMHPVAELMLGIIRDNSGAFLMTIAAGGTNAEILDDARSLLLPFTDDEFLSALTRLRCWPILQGYRNCLGADIGAILSASHCLAEFARTHEPQILEVEINPFLALDSGGVAADALIRRQCQDTP
ncbi:MAG: acetate--CoA ligase family protein [Rhodobacteraceae bacterium]|nr:acetate--CoA ligase family protein [Paracoccaceae bacterium]